MLYAFSQAHSISYALSQYVLYALIYALSQYVLYALSQYALYALSQYVLYALSQYVLYALSIVLMHSHINQSRMGINALCFQSGALNELCTQYVLYALSHQYVLCALSQYVLYALSHNMNIIITNPINFATETFKTKFGAYKKFSCAHMFFLDGHICGYDQRVLTDTSQPFVDGILGQGLGEIGILNQLQKLGVTKKRPLLFGTVELYVGGKTTGMNVLEDGNICSNKFDEKRIVHICS
nr:hypothetical protein [Tanacetum cinerariifolium]